MSEIKYKVKGGFRYMARFQWKGEPITQGGFLKRKDAKSWAEAEKRRLKKQSRQIGGDFVQIAELYLDHCILYHKKGTVGEKRYCYKEFIAEMGEALPSKNQIKHYISTIASEHSPKTANSRLKLLKSLFSWSLKEGLIPFDPAYLIGKLPIEKYVPYVPPAEDITKVMLVASPDEQDFLTILRHTAARRSEVVNLTWDDINFEHQWIRLWTNKRKGGNREARILRMNDFLAETMRRRWTRRDKETAYVFANHNHQKWNADGSRFIGFMMVRLCKKAGVKHFGFHAIRHRVASILQDGGKAGVRDIQRFLGHKNVTTTEIYLHDLQVVETGRLLTENPKSSIGVVNGKPETIDIKGKQPF